MKRRPGARIGLTLATLALLGVVLTVVTANLGWAQGPGGIQGIWKQCNGSGYLVLLQGGQQVNVVGAQVEVGTYSFDGSRVHIGTSLFYNGSGSVQRVSAASESVAWYTYNPQNATLVGQGGGPGQCYAKLPGQ